MRKKTETDQVPEEPILKSRFSIKGFSKHFLSGIISGFIVLFEALIIFLLLYFTTGHLPNDSLGLQERTATGALWLFIGAFLPGFGSGPNIKSKGKINYGCLPLILSSFLCVLIFAFVGTSILKLSTLYASDIEGIALYFVCGIMFGFVSWIYVSDKINLN